MIESPYEALFAVSRSVMSKPFPAEPLVSVVTPTFNQGAYIRETIESVRRQTYRNFEHIVVDGGSTDDTVSILKSYPDIQWISEPDRGQADALNKALRLAKGDVIAWINSDDIYDKQALELAVQALENHAIVMGRCVVFQDGKGPLYTVANFGRTWFDLLKYWIAYAIPTQPAIFFRRSLLDEVACKGSEAIDPEAVNPGSGGPEFVPEFVDPDLHYCMDYDLWLRMAINNPLINRIDAATSLYRFTDTNKTSPTRSLLSYAGAEMAAVFRRAEAMLGSSKHVSYLIHAEEPSDALSATIQSLLSDRTGEIEVIIVTPKVTGPLRRYIEEINAAQEAANYRQFVLPIVSLRPGMPGRISDAIERCAGRIAMVLPAGAIAPKNLSASLNSYFLDDRLGVVLPFAGDTQLMAGLTASKIEDAEHADFCFDTFTFSVLPYFAFAVRRATWLEGPELRDDSHPLREIKRLVFSHIRQGWHVRMNLPLNVSLPPAPEFASPIIFGQLTGAELIAESAIVVEKDPFWPVRNGYRLCLAFSEGAVEKANMLLRKAPLGWTAGFGL